MTIEEYFQLLARGINNRVSHIRYWWNRLSDQRHWYEVRYIYSKNGSTLFNWVSRIGVRKRATTLNRRELKKILTPLHMDDRIRNRLCNGKLDVEIMCYLGCFHESNHDK